MIAPDDPAAVEVRWEGCSVSRGPSSRCTSSCCAAEDWFLERPSEAEAVASACARPERRRRAVWCSAPL